MASRWLFSVLAPVVASQTSIEDGSLLQVVVNKNNMAVDASSKAATQSARSNLLIRRMDTQFQGARALVEKVIANGPSVIPTDEIFDQMIGPLTTIEDELVAENAVNQQIVNDANGVVAACYTQNNATFTDLGGVNDKKTEADTAKSKHTLCRTTEQNNIGQQTNSCNTFDNAENPKQCADFEWFAQHGHAAADAAQTCKTHTDARNAKAAQCDHDQGQYEAKFCSYASVLKVACSTLTSCHTNAMAQRATKIEEAQELVTSHKTIYTSVARIKCLFNVLKTARTTNITKDDITHCAVILVDDVKHLEIQETPAAGGEDCDESPVAVLPGDGTWSYDVAWSAELQEVNECTTSTTTAAPPASTQPPTAPPAQELCISATNPQGTEFDASGPMTGIRVEYVSGYVTCHTPGGVAAQSHWGCTPGNQLGMLIIDGSEQVYPPNVNNGWYVMNGFDNMSPSLEFKGDHTATGKMRIVYGDAIGSGVDNGGSTCVKLHVV